MTDTKHYANIKNSSDKDIVVLDSFSQKDNSGNLIDQLKILTNNTDSSQLIKASSTGKVTLDDTYIDPDTKQSEPSLAYRLLLSSSTTLFPYSVAPVDFILSDDDANVELKADDVKLMQSAAQFYMSINAYPSSDLAKGFRSALNSASQTGSSSDDITTQVNNFFKSTKGYQNLTLSTYTALSSYYTAFPFVWAEFKSSKTYYLYSSDGTSPLKAQGTVILTSTGSGVPDPTNTDGGYNVQYTDTSGKTTTLHYANGQFVSDLSTDLPDIALTGSFSLKSRLTATPSDNQIIAILTGTLYGTTVIGLDTQQNNASKTSDSFWKTLFEPKGAQQIIQSMMIIGGLAMMAHFLLSSVWKLGKYLHDKATQGKKPTNEQIEEARAKANAESKQSFDDAVKKNSGGKEQAPDNVDEAQTVAEDAMEQQLAWGNKTNIEITLEFEDVRIRIIIENAPGGVTPDMETAARELRSTNTALKNATPDNIADVVKTQSTSINNTSSKINDIQSEISEQVSSDVKAQLDAQQKISEDASDALEEAEKNADDTSSGESDGEGDDFPDVDV